MWFILQVLEHTDDTIKCVDRLTVTSLTGLSEVYQKRGRSMRNNEMEWHRMYLYAITAQVGDWAREMGRVTSVTPRANDDIYSL